MLPRGYLALKRQRHLDLGEYVRTRSAERKRLQKGMASPGSTRKSIAVPKPLQKVQTGCVWHRRGVWGKEGGCVVCGGQRDANKWGTRKMGKEKVRGERERARALGCILKWLCAHARARTRTHARTHTCTHRALCQLPTSLSQHQKRISKTTRKPSLVFTTSGSR